MVSLCRPVWPWIHSHAPASTSQCWDLYSLLAAGLPLNQSPELVSLPSPVRPLVNSVALLTSCSALACLHPTSLPTGGSRVALHFALSLSVNSKALCMHNSCDPRPHPRLQSCFLFCFQKTGSGCVAQAGLGLPVLKRSSCLPSSWDCGQRVGQGDSHILRAVRIHPHSWLLLLLLLPPPP